MDKKQGRKKLPAGEKKTQLWFFIQQKYIDQVGGWDAASELAFKLFFNSLQKND